MSDGERIRDLEAALAGLVGAIDTHAADTGPPPPGPLMAQVCRVIQETGQYELARRALRRTGLVATSDGQPSRCVHLTIRATGQTFSLTGLPADLVALIAATTLSEKMLRLLIALTAGHQKVDALKSGRIEVDVSRGKLHPYTREAWPRVDFAETEEEVTT